MILNNIGIVQSDNKYLLYLPQNYCVCQVAFPPDGQYIHDSKALDIITKALALRWGVNNQQKGSKG